MKERQEHAEKTLAHLKGEFLQLFEKGQTEKTLAHLKGDFLELFEKGDLDEVQIRNSFIKLLFTQVPFSRVFRTAASTLKTDPELQKQPPELFYDFIVNYVQTYVEDIENLRLMVHHSIEKIKKDSEKRKPFWSRRQS